MENVLDWKPLRNPATSYTLDSRPMEGITNLERSDLGVSLDRGPTEGRRVWNHWSSRFLVRR